jgi:hypothetical protein
MEWQCLAGQIEDLGAFRPQGTYRARLKAEHLLLERTELRAPIAHCELPVASDMEMCATRRSGGKRSCSSRKTWRAIYRRSDRAD